MKIEKDTTFTIASYDFPAPDAWSFPFVFRTEITKKDLKVKIPTDLNSILAHHLWKKVHKLTQQSKYSLSDIAKKIGLTDSKLNTIKINNVMKDFENGLKPEDILKRYSNLKLNQIQSIIAMAQETNSIGYIFVKLKPKMIKDLVSIIKKLKTPSSKEKQDLITKFNNEVLQTSFTDFKTQVEKYRAKEETIVDAILENLSYIEKYFSKIRSVMIPKEIIKELTRLQNHAIYIDDPNWKLIDEVQPNWEFIKQIGYDDLGEIDSIYYAVTLKVFTKTDLVPNHKKNNDPIPIDELLINARGTITTRLRRLGLNSYQKSQYLIPKASARAPRDDKGFIIRDPCTRRIHNEDDLKDQILKDNNLTKNTLYMEILDEIIVRVRGTKDLSNIIKQSNKITAYIIKKHPNQEKFKTLILSLVENVFEGLEIERKQFTWEEVCICELSPVYESVIGFLYEPPNFKIGDYAWDSERSLLYRISGSVQTINKKQFIEGIKTKNLILPNPKTELVSLINLKKPKVKYTVDNGKYLRKTGTFEKWLVFLTLRPEDNYELNNITKIMSKGMIAKGSSFHRIIDDIKDTESTYLIPIEDPKFKNNNPKLLQKRLNTILDKYQKALDTYPFASYCRDKKKITKGWHFSCVEKLPESSTTIKMEQESDDIIDIRQEIETRIVVLEDLIPIIQIESTKKLILKNIGLYIDRYNTTDAQKDSLKAKIKDPSSDPKQIEKLLDDKYAPIDKAITEDIKKLYKGLLEIETKSQASIKSYKSTLTKPKTTKPKKTKEKKTIKPKTTKPKKPSATMVVRTLPVIMNEIMQEIDKYNISKKEKLDLKVKFEDPSVTLDDIKAFMDHLHGENPQLTHDILELYEEYLNVLETVKSKSQKEEEFEFAVEIMRYEYRSHRPTGLFGEMLERKLKQYKIVDLKYEVFQTEEDTPYGQGVYTNKPIPIEILKATELIPYNDKAKEEYRKQMKVEKPKVSKPKKKSSKAKKAKKTKTKKAKKSKKKGKKKN